MTPNEIEYCQRLMEAADRIVDDLKPGEIEGAINWGDLGCSLVERVESYAGPGSGIETAWRVVIEEASPGAYKLASYVSIALSGEGFKDVEVQCEW